MARNTMEAWIKEEQGSDVIRKLGQTSAAETSFKSVPMTSQTKSQPRMEDMGVEVVPKGGTYGEDQSLNDEVMLNARKFGKALRVAEEDVDDNLVDVITAKKTSWVTSFGIALDNATMATTGAENGGTVPFTSIYKALGTANAATGYAAGANQIVTAGALAYDHISDLASRVEEGGFHDASSALFIAHPVVKGLVRKLKDSTGAPLFVQNPRQGEPDTLFGYPVKWSNGLRLSATNTSTPATGTGVKGTAGNAIIVFLNTDFALLGKRSGPESVLFDGRSGASPLTDEIILKVRARRAFVLAHEKAAAVLEITSA